MPKTQPINTFNENPLHAALKRWYAQSGDQLEVHVDNFIIDVVHDDLLIEIQTSSFSSIKRKLQTLTQTHPVLLVYPIAREKWIVKPPKTDQGKPRRRKSPKRGRITDLFNELVSFPDLITSPNFTLDVVFIQEEEHRHHDPKSGSWRRRGWVIDERRLIQVLERRRFTTPADMRPLIPADLASPFTTADLAQAAGISRRLAQRMAYCLRHMGELTPVGHRNRSILYTRTHP